MRIPRLRTPVFAVTLAAAAVSAQTSAPRANITTPLQQFGFEIGTDYQMVNYAKESAYLQKLASESDRMKLVEIGKTAEGRPQYMAILSSPENIAKLDHYKEIARKLALAKDLTEDQARTLSEEGKAVVWIDGGLHATETVGAQQLIQTIYMLNSATDPEITRILNDEIVLCTFDNPDGMDLVADWYNREPTPEKRVTEGPAGAVPRLWQKYVGHDNNRDFFLNAQNETANISRILFRDWYPQIIYNHHQTGPVGTVIFMPPFRDPFNYNYDPLIISKLEVVGSNMHTRLIEEGKPGSTMRSGANYSTWYNGGLRTISYFHNSVGILTEIIGSPTPMQIPLIPGRQIGSDDLPDPIPPQTWHYKQSIAYELTNNRSIMDYASREKSHLLFDMWVMGQDSIKKGSEDSWTITPKRIDALVAAGAAAAPPTGRGRNGAPVAGAALGGNGNAPGLATSSAGKPVPAELYNTVLHDPKLRDPRGYIITADQPDFPTATKFVNALIKSGVTVEQATAPFTVAGKQYPANSYVVMTAQAYRPQVMDMFEPQDHPNDFAYPGAPPNRPYDATGWTLVKQFGVAYDRVLDGFTGPFQPIATESSTALAKPLPGTVTGSSKPRGYLVSHSYNDGFILTNRLLKAKQPVFWLTKPVSAEGKDFPAGALWIPASAESKTLVDTAAHDLGISAVGVATAPASEKIELHPQRIALYDQYGGLMPSGWLRFLFEAFEFPYTVVYPQNLDAGDLKNKFDVVIFTDGAIRTPNGGGGEGFGGRQPEPDQIPTQFRPWLGTITQEKTIPALQTFVQNGGEILAIGSSSKGLYTMMNLPISNALSEINKGVEQQVPGERFYIPGSLIKADVDNSNPIAFGMNPTADVFFDNSPAFRLDPDAAKLGAQTIAWYGKGNLLDSGWAWGQNYLNESAAVVQVRQGKGRVVLYGPEVTFRGQPHGTFKLLFNAMELGAE